MPTSVMTIVLIYFTGLLIVALINVVFRKCCKIYFEEKREYLINLTQGEKENG